MSLGRFIIAIFILVIILYILNDVIITHIMPQYNVPSSYDSIISKSLFLIGGIGTYILALNTPNITKRMKKKKPSVLDVHEYICELKKDPSPTISEQKTGRGLDTKSGGFVMTDDAYRRVLTLYTTLVSERKTEEDKIAVVNKMYEDIGFIVDEPDPNSKDMKKTQVRCGTMQDALDLLTQLSNAKKEMIIDEKDKNKRQFPHSVYIEDKTDPDLNSRSTSADLNSNYILYDMRRQDEILDFKGYTKVGYLMNIPDFHWIALVQYNVDKWFMCNDDKITTIDNIDTVVKNRMKTNKIAAILYKKDNVPYKYKNDDRPLALPKLGNTCYLNALLQILLLMDNKYIIEKFDDIIALHNKRDAYINKPNELSNKIADILWYYIQIAYPNIDQDPNGFKGNYDAFFQFLETKNILNYNEQQNKKLKNIYEQAVFKDQKNIQEQLNTYNENDLLGNKIYARYRTYYGYSTDAHKSDLTEEEKQFIQQLVDDKKPAKNNSFIPAWARNATNAVVNAATNGTKKVAKAVADSATIVLSAVVPVTDDPAPKTPTDPIKEPDTTTDEPANEIGTTTDGPATKTPTDELDSKKDEFAAAYKQLNNRVERVNDDNDLKQEFNVNPGRDWYNRWLNIMFAYDNVLKSTDSTEIQAMITEVTYLYNTFPINDGESPTSLKPDTEQTTLNSNALAFVPNTKTTEQLDDEVSTKVVREKSDVGDPITTKQAEQLYEIVKNIDKITDSDIPTIQEDKEQLNNWLQNLKKEGDVTIILDTNDTINIDVLIEEGEKRVTNIINKAVAAELRKSIVDTVSTISITTPNNLDDVDDEEADEVTDAVIAAEDKEVNELEADLKDGDETKENKIVQYLIEEDKNTCEDIDNRLKQYLKDVDKKETNVNYIGDLKNIQRALLLTFIKKLKKLEKPRFASQVIKKIKSITDNLKKHVYWNKGNNVKDITNNIAVVLEMIKNPTFDDDEDFSFGSEPYSDYANSFKKLDQNERYGFGKTPFDKYFKELKNEEL